MFLLKYLIEERSLQRIKSGMRFSLYNQLSPEELKIATQKIGDVLKLESDHSKITEIFKLMRSDLWLYLQNDVQLRMDNMILEDCQKGSFNTSYLGIL